MAENTPGPPPPSEHHQRLHDKVGVWDVDCRYFMDPGGDPIAAAGTDEVEALGAFWTTARFRCQVMGNTISGLATTGYDPVRGKYIGTWQDSATPYFYYFEGDMDEDGALVMVGENVDPMSGQLATYRSVERCDGDTRSLELFIEVAPGREVQILEYRYKRAAR
ncbi:MAG: DUF1579 family protein [Planctomycetes bacterium]|nr:DUF1579 family protein [Planctomycetota bacterium]MCB9870376.1 DUF1579 family protein [Planctomycetota bacterium]